MSNDYIRQIAQDTGVSEEYLNSLWNDAEQRVDGDVEKDNPAYWQKVITEFNKLIDHIDIKEAKFIMSTREDYNRAANDFFNNIIEDDFGVADEMFGKMVDSRLRLMINKERDNYYKNVLQDKARKIAAGD